MNKLVVKKISDLASIVVEKRKRDGLTQAEAASLSGVGIRFLSDLENGKETLQISKILQVLEGLGLVIEAKERNF